VTQRSDGGADLGALAPWANELAQTFVSLSSDIALVLDADGVIRNVAQASGEPLTPTAMQWIGRPWVDTVTGATRRKIEQLLGDVATTGIGRRREVNLAAATGAEIPVAYTAIRLGVNGPLLAVGRDLRAIAAIQQRFLDAQQELERGYWQARQNESRDRTLWQVATDAVLVVDAQSSEIVAASRVALQRLGKSASPLAGRSVVALFDTHSRSPVEELLAASRSSGRPMELRARVADGALPCSVLATPFRSVSGQRLLVRLRSGEPAQAAALAAGPDDGVAITDSSGHIVAGDSAFAGLLGTASDTLRGRSLADWLGTDAGEFADVLAEVRRDGLAERPAMMLRAGDGTKLQAHVSACWMTEGDRESIGFVIQRLAAPPADAARAAFADAWASLDGQLGSASLSEMLREAAALAERHFIEIALQRAQGDAEQAARLLGVSRDSLRQRRGTSAGDAP
jgi:transcriptional regulator PpsR